MSDTSHSGTTLHVATRDKLLRHIARKAGGQRIDPEFFAAQRFYGVPDKTTWALLNELSESQDLVFFNVPTGTGGAVTWCRAVSR
jgi:hypothetical protein